jgi:ABC-type transport system involved in multi-copper enzyme maturation permease subunit
MQLRNTFFDLNFLEVWIMLSLALRALLTFLLAPFLLLLLLIMLVAVMCDCSAFRLKANWAGPVPPKGKWEF